MAAPRTMDTKVLPTVARSSWRAHFSIIPYMVEDFNQAIVSSTVNICLRLMHAEGGGAHHIYQSTSNYRCPARSFSAPVTRLQRATVQSGITRTSAEGGQHWHHRTSCSQHHRGHIGRITPLVGRRAYVTPIPGNIGITITRMDEGDPAKISTNCYRENVYLWVSHRHPSPPPPH